MNYSNCIVRLQTHTMAYKCVVFKTIRSLKQSGLDNEARTQIPQKIRKFNY